MLRQKLIINIWLLHLVGFSLSSHFAHDPLSQEPKPRSRILLDKLWVRQLFGKFPVCSEAWQFITVFTRAGHFLPILSQNNPNYIFLLVSWNTVLYYCKPLYMGDYSLWKLQQRQTHNFGKSGSGLWFHLGSTGGNSNCQLYGSNSVTLPPD
jgi:hypothetical protein